MSIVEKTENEIKYFAAANSANGFKNYFDEIFANLNKLYIIKGGPGTGKSKLMNDIANEAKNNNHTVEYFYCSSDPKSLDGIIISDLRLGVVDGTSPHTKEPIYPGVCEEIINLGDFWKSNKLIDDKSIICDSVDKKNILYKSVYHYLNAANQVDQEFKLITKRFTNIDKLQSATNRILKEIKRGSGYKYDIRIQEAISMDGIFKFDTFYNIAEKKYIISDNYKIGYLLLREIHKIAIQKNQPVVISYSPLNGIFEDAIYLPEAKTAFIISSESKPDDKIINMDRFICKDLLKQYKQKLRFNKKCYQSLMEGAITTLGEIKKIHFTLENIYGKAMDFKHKEEYTKKLLSKLFK